MPREINRLIISVLLLTILIIPSHASNVSVVYFHMPNCNDCAVTDPIIKQCEQEYSNVTFEWGDISTLEGLNRWHQYGFTEVPALVINNTRIPKEGITEKNLSMAINAYTIDNKTVATKNTFVSISFEYTYCFFYGRLFRFFSLPYGNSWIHSYVYGRYE